MQFQFQQFSPIRKHQPLKNNRTATACFTYAAQAIFFLCPWKYPKRLSQCSINCFFSPPNHAAPKRSTNASHPNLPPDDDDDDVNLLVHVTAIDTTMEVQEGPRRITRTTCMVSRQVKNRGRKCGTLGLVSKGRYLQCPKLPIIAWRVAELLSQTTEYSYVTTARRQH